ncbi:hypothetical protein CANCADRAFT_132560 [Tortispora caseinolytica NRRL Y-17796]|uniref:CTLH domain-containing protein n=1 Tax=Tortispora caseinolytica NRRL Y-17796 TaxID=767744 RepID=A0A1E4TB64_9ASCO|nr:hypothetical protein CANCADRAFT_132560 [Tortispora caseinolytica NRRL Y-17796]
MPVDPMSPTLPISRPASTYCGHNVTEVTRLMIQALSDIGYSDLATSLEKASGYSIETPEVASFRKAILSGDWDDVEARIRMLELKPGVDVESLVFSVHRQKFLELLQAKEVQKAMVVLRTQLSTYQSDLSKLHHLSSLVMCTSTKDLCERANWESSRPKSRLALLESIQDKISPSVMIAPHRLATLLTQAQESQISKCLYHCSNQDMTLYTDHCCTKNNFPTVTTHELVYHSNEVWYAQFSHDGKKLASASKDGTVAIWDLDSFSLLHVLDDHSDSVTYIGWSPDDSMMLTCSRDTTVKLWDMTDYTLMCTLNAHQVQVSSCAWLPNGKEFVTSSLDPEIILWNTSGTKLYTWSDDRIYDLSITADGKKMVSICTRHMIHVYDLETREKTSQIFIGKFLTCVSTSSDSRYALVNVTADEIHLWDIEKIQLVRKYVGQRQGHFIIRSCFGGPSQNFVASGSEDSRVYIWNREYGTLIDTLPGHVGTVNCVAWNPKDPEMFASAGDDHVIRIWEPKSRLLGDSEKLSNGNAISKGKLRI